MTDIMRQAMKNLDMEDAAKRGVAPEPPVFTAHTIPETTVTEAPVSPKLVPTRYITEIGKSLSGAPIAVAYDFCRCGQHVVNCKCVGGPFEPGYITAMRARETELSLQRERDLAERAEKAATTPVRSTSVPAKASASPESPVSLATAVADKCDVCGKAASGENADRNDDGTYTHYDCQ